jgi:hypothetical protein
MARPEDIEAQYRDGRLRVSGVGKPVVEISWLDERYEIETPEPAVRTETGHLVVFKLQSNDPDLPKFSARWDEKDRTVDIDIHGVPRMVQLAFETMRAGYAGSHTQQRTWADPLKFQFTVRLPPSAIPGLPNGRVAEGSVELTELWLRAHVFVTAQLREKAEAQVNVRASAADTVSVRDEASARVTPPAVNPKED